MCLHLQKLKHSRLLVVHLHLKRQKIIASQPFSSYLFFFSSCQVVGEGLARVGTLTTTNLGGWCTTYYPAQCPVTIQLLLAVHLGVSQQLYLMLHHLLPCPVPIQLLLAVHLGVSQQLAVG